MGGVGSSVEIIKLRNRNDFVCIHTSSVFRDTGGWH